MEKFVVFDELEFSKLLHRLGKGRGGGQGGKSRFFKMVIVHSPPYIFVYSWIALKEMTYCLYHKDRF